MQHLNDDMEGLFQRAADNYPLDPGPDSWQTILDQVNQHRSVKPLTEENKRSQMPIVMMLLTLLFSSGLFIVLKNNGITLSNAGQSKVSGAYNVSRSSGIVQTPQTGLLAKKNIIKTFETASRPGAGQSNPGDTIALNRFEQSINRRFRPDRSFTNDVTRPTQNNLAEDERERSFDKTNGVDADIQKAEQQDNKPIATPDLIVNKQHKNSRFNHKKSFYMGALAGADFSRVKSMPFNSAGISAGLYGELKLSPVWSLQTAVVLNKKHYLGEGREFSMDKVKDAMTGMTINNVQSRSTIIEIPISAKLYLMRNRTRGAFVSGGIASYIMTSEKNQYDVMHNGLPEKYNGYYKTNSYNGFAAATFSIGYQNKLLHNTELNIAPYLNIPLKGIGVGSLPVTSAGLRISIGTRVR